MAPDGSDLQSLLPGAVNSFDAAWSRDGRPLSFITIYGSNRSDLFVARGDGTRIQLVSGPAGFAEGGGAEWSPRGETLAFHSFRDGDHDIYLMDVRHPWLTWNPTDKIGDGSNDCGCGGLFWTYSASSFSPDGGQLVFTSDAAAVGTNLDIYMIRADGTGLRRLTTDPAIDAEVDLSPDGRTIVFDSTRDGDKELYVMDTRGRHVRQLTYNGATDRQPEWSPDGSRITYASDLSRHDDIWVMNADGSKPRNLTNDEDFDERPAWQPLRRGHDDD